MKLHSMIFVTVGNGQFDALTQEIDTLKERGEISGNVIIQIGLGSYEPRHCRWFRFEPSLEKYYKGASLVISHGGPGIVFEVLRLGKKLLAVPNTDRTDPRHQVEFLKALSEETTALLYCPSVQQLHHFLQKARKHQFSPYQPPECTIHQEISRFLS